MKARQGDREGRLVRIVQLAGAEETFPFLRHFSTALASEGFEVVHAARPGGSVDHRGINFVPLPLTRCLHPASILKAIWLTAAFLRRQRADVLIASTFAGGVIGRLAGRLARVPVVYYWPHGWLFQPKTSNWKRLLIVWTERFLAHFCDAVICISEEETRIGRQEKLLQRPERTIQLLGIGIDTQRYSPNCIDEARRLSLRNELGLECRHFVFIFVGRLVQEKGLFELLLAFEQVLRRHPHARLVLVGDIGSHEPDQSSKRRLLEQIDQSTAREALFRTGYRSDIPELLRSSDAYIFPSWREGMPVSLLEAMAMELPVVATDIPGCREEVLDGETGLVVSPRDSAALAQAMEKLINDPANARLMGKAARRRVEQHFSRAAVVPLLVDSLNVDQILAGQPVTRFKTRDLDLTGYRWPRERTGR